MDTAYFISRRLRLTPGEGRRRLSTNVVVAVAGIACAVAVMLLSIGVVLGFKNAIRAKVAGFEPAISVEAAANYSGDAIVPVTIDGPAGKGIAMTLPGARATLAIRHAGILKTDSDFLGVVFRSLPADSAARPVAADMLTAGRLPAPGAREVLVSTGQARKTGLGPGDKVYAYFFVNGALKARRYTVSGTFTSNFGDYDDLVAFLPYDELRGVAGLAPGEGTRIEIEGVPVERIREGAELLQMELNRAYAFGETGEPAVVDTVLRSGAVYYNWLGLLDTNVVVILILMGCVSGFTLVSSVFILILERVRLIAVLKSMGADDALVRRVFVYLGGRVAAIGLAIGNAAALGLMLAQIRWRFLPLDPRAYYLAYVPVEISWWQVAALDLGVVAVAAALMLIPAAVVSRISPARTMRFE